ncbi:quaternary ammonium compound-resistance protein SugE [Brevibacterium iodinum ATCC 49514]|uniref:Quaternary ammonium compound-resistance protein SugE n=1 Tax=Brevibacterium iodinum ATCC 49514 TaxID=1255616 RepID=A0A2H1KJ34_9MICO|nr:multidrug efflux SMR transporter [Brevibacterium iodinum]SMX99785.1 quaternary ammonium compound-resistance protein SugE [Brevibacterium iodinum ATCC 49514]SUW11384.1 Quaternary ammonium compound-resistance protein sugE [Brevibacterium iodinum]
MTTTATHDITAPDTTEKRAGPWLALLLAGGFEVGYALSVNGSEGFTNLTWSLIAIVFFLFTLFFLSVALKKIDVGIGYAVWAGIGAVGAALLGPVFFDETLTLVKGFWLAVIIGGVIWLKLADSPKLEAKNSDGQAAAGPEQHK